MNDLFNYKRRESTVAHAGSTAIGGGNPIRVQSMTTTNTNDTEACVAQAERIIKAGGELVRLTTQGTREAKNLKNINAALPYMDADMRELAKRSWPTCTSILTWQTWPRSMPKRCA